MTKKLYLEDAYLYEISATIIVMNQDAKGEYILLDKSIFYPQGGGQPSDHGTIQSNDFELEIFHVMQIEDELRHYIKQPQEDIYQNSQALCKVDKTRRILNAKYHTSGHLISNLIEKIYPNLKAIKGHSFPGEAYVEFQGAEALIDKDIIEDSLKQVILNNLPTKIFEADLVSFENDFYKLPYQIPGNKAFRVMQIGEFLPIPCGGTHVKNLSEIQEIKINKMKLKNDKLHIAYSCST